MQFKNCQNSILNNVCIECFTDHDIIYEFVDRFSNQFFLNKNIKGVVVFKL